MFTNLLILKKIKKLEIMYLLTDVDKEKIRKDVSVLIERVYNIQKIRRKRKIREWLKSHIKK